MKLLGAFTQRDLSQLALSYAGVTYHNATAITRQGCNRHFEPTDLVWIMAGIFVPKTGCAPSHDRLDTVNHTTGVGDISGLSLSADSQIIGTNIGICDRCTGLCRICGRKTSPGFIDRYDHTFAIEHRNICWCRVQHILRESLLLMDYSLTLCTQQCIAYLAGHQSQQVESRGVFLAGDSDLAKTKETQGPTLTPDGESTQCVDIQ